MVQLQVNLSSSTDFQHIVNSSHCLTSSSQHQQSDQKGSKQDTKGNNQSPATHLSISAWRAMLERSNKRLEKYNDLQHSEDKLSHKLIPDTPKFDKDIVNTCEWEISEDEIYPSSGKNSSVNFTHPMQKESIKGSGTDHKSYLTSYQESLMTTCSEIIDSLTSEKDSEEISKNIKIERSGSSDQDDWISGFTTAISTNTTNETDVTIKQELQSDEAAFNRSARSSSSYSQHHPLSLMPPTSNPSGNHEVQGVRSNSISSVSGESVIDTEMSCTSPSPSSIPVSSTSNTLSTYNINQSQVNHLATAAPSSSMVNRHNTPTPGSPSSNPSSIMTSPSAPTSAAAQHSFTLTPLGPHISSGPYGGIPSGSSVPSSSYFPPPGCPSNPSTRYGNTNPQQQHNFDASSFHNTWNTPFGGAGIPRTNYNGIQGFMSGQNQVFSGSQFQNNVVSNAEGSSPFFTHGSGGGGLIAPPSNGGQNADRNSRGGDSNESSPHGVNSGSNSPHLSHGIFGHGVDESHGTAGGGGHPVGVIGGTTTRKREIRLIKNREAARECRRKKKEYIKCLENRVAVLENQNKALIEELKSLKSLYNSSSSTKMPSNEGMKGN